MTEFRIRYNKPVIGWILYDFANSAFATIVLAVIFNQYFAGEIAGGESGVTLRLPFTGSEGWHLPGATAWNYLVVLSTALVALSAPLLGAMADHSSRRKTFLTIYCLVGVLSTIALGIPGKGDLWLASALFILANFGFAGGNVFYNAFLLDLSPKEHLGRVSGYAWGFGYAGGGICLALNLILLMKPEMLGVPAGVFRVQHSMILAGVWWGVFAIPTLFWLQDRPRSVPRASVFVMMALGWRRILVTFREIRKHKQLVRFLLAFLIYNDGVETVIIMASIFGAQVVGLKPGELVGYFILIQFTGLIGSFLFGWLADKISKKTSILISLFIWVLVVIWAFKIGWLFDVRTDFFIMGVFAGMVMGGTQSVSRSFQALFTPPEKSAEFFGFFAVSGRFAAIFGPAMYGTAILLFGGVQSGILALGALFVIGGAILWTVDETAYSGVSLR